MADRDRDSDGDEWEEASDVFEVRSEADISEPEGSSNRDTDDKSGILREVAPPVAPRRGRLERETGNCADGGRQERSPRARRGDRLRTSELATPQSEYRLAPLPRHRDHRRDLVPKNLESRTGTGRSSSHLDSREKITVLNRTSPSSRLSRKGTGGTSTKKRTS